MQSFINGEMKNVSIRCTTFNPVKGNTCNILLMLKPVLKHVRPILLCSDSFTTENIVPTMIANDVIPSAPQPSSGYQPAWVSPRGQMSMADIVKKGRPQIKKSTIPASSAGSHPDGHGSTARDHNVSVDDEWPLIEPSQAATNMSSISETRANSEHHPDPFNLPSDRTNEHVESETYEVQAAEDDGIENNVGGNHIGTGSVSSRKMQEDNSGGASLFDNDLYKDMGSYQPHNHAFEHQEGEYSFIL